MCGRLAYGYPPAINQVITRFKAPALDGIVQTYNVPPTSQVPVLYMAGKLQSSMMRWGFTPTYWPKQTPLKPLFNARSDTIWSKPNYRDSLERRHCILFATGFYEWNESSPVKQPWYIRMAGDRPLAIAAIWQQSAENRLECCLITTDANQLMTPIHHRMPVILDAGGIRAWLETYDHATVNELMAPCPSAWLEATPVSAYVNDVRNTDQRCVEPPRDRQVVKEQQVLEPESTATQISIKFDP